MNRPKIFALAFGRRVALSWDGHALLCAAGEVAKAVPVEVEYADGEATVRVGNLTGRPKAVAKALRHEIALAGWANVRVVKAKAVPVPPPRPLARR